MKSKQPPVIYRVVSRGDKIPLGSHNSGSTVQASDHRITSTKTSQVYNAESSPPPKCSKSPQSQTISILRSQLKNIKSSVTRLIEQGLVKPPSTVDWLESSQNFSSFSKNSLGGSTIKSNSNKSPQPFSKVLDQSLTKHRNELQQLQNLRQDHQKLKIMCRIKDEKQADAIMRHKKLSQQTNALRKSKQQLIKCIQLLQLTVRQTNQQLKYYLNQNKRLQQHLMKLDNEKNIKQKDFLSVNLAVSRLEQQMEYRKAENNELIRIIELKQEEVQLLKAKHAQQIRNIQNQNRNWLIQNQQRNSRMDQNQGQYMRRSASNDKSQQFFRRIQLDRLHTQVQILKSQLQNRQKVMAMMLNDIRGMDKQLKQFDLEHEQLLRCRKLIQSLNSKLMDMEAKKLAIKYKYF